MKIVHIARSDGWGAGTAAIRLHEGLMRSGADSTFLCLNKKTATENVVVFKKRNSFLDRLLRKLWLKSSLHEKQAARLAGADGIFEAFTFATSEFRIEDHPLVKEADIIHLHWVANFINFPTFFKNIKQPVVWTLHDMNPFMGGFHYENDQRVNAGKMARIDNGVFEEKRKGLPASGKLTIAAPSAWLLGKSAVSQQLKRFPHMHIPYGLDLEIFKPYDQLEVKSELGIGADKRLILFISDSVGNHRKGFDLLMSAAAGFDFEKAGIMLGVVGEQGNIPASGNTIFFGKIKDAVKLAKIYSASDLFILPSREDNFPNVMLEALACGTPVMAFSNGGMREVIRTGENGMLLDELSSEALKNGLKDFIDHRYQFDRNSIRKLVEENFHLKKQAAEYLKLYEALLNDRNGN